MNFSLNIITITPLREIPDYWQDSDYICILEELEVTDTKNSSPSELRELLEMALSDLEPHEAAELLLRYKLKGRLNPGQIQNLSHEMVEDNESEEYPDIELHYPLFNINQLLHAAFKGVFPRSQATRLEVELKVKGDVKAFDLRELMIKALACGLSDRSIILRLFEEQLNGEEPFTDAEDILWEVESTGSHLYSVLTSDYWISEEDFVEAAFSGTIHFFEEDED